MYLNKIYILGNLTRDPEVKALPSGSKVTSFSVATNRSFKNKDGAKTDSVEFHNIVVFGKSAENCGTYLRKGQQVLIEGRIQTRSWDADGGKKYRTEIIAESVQFGPKALKSSTTDAEPTHEVDADSGAVRPASDGGSGKTAYAGDASNGIEYPTEEINPDDIPF